MEDSYLDSYWEDQCESHYDDREEWERDRLAEDFALERDEECPADEDCDDAFENEDLAENDDCEGCCDCW